MMNKLTKKDQRILFELDQNSRQTDSQIAKKIGLSKQVVNYRINNLLKKKIISEFYTTLDIAKLGLNTYYVFLQLANINRQKEESLIKQLDELDFVGWLLSGLGRWDVCVSISADTMELFDSLLSKIIAVCEDYLYDYTFTMLFESSHLSYKFVNPKQFKKIIQQEKKEKISLDKIDIAILRQIASNARISLTEIQKKTKIPIHTSAYRLKSLEKQKLILGYKPKLDLGVLGLQWHLLLLKFQNVSEKRKKELIYFCENHKNVYYLTRTIGSYNLMLDVHVKTSDEFRKVVLELRDKFSDVIKIYESIFVFKEHKISYFPEELLK
ncbi:Lrp/AsnC family transcriptional regulator [Candidatus Woesearchaeota archaeon]|nr:Lrp/AsnC family transcriptional regulator [Candidatus Woesearchaeota archaeon]